MKLFNFFYLQIFSIGKTEKEIELKVKKLVDENFSGP